MRIKFTASGSSSAALDGYGDAATAFDHESRSYMQVRLDDIRSIAYLSDNYSDCS